MYHQYPFSIYPSQEQLDLLDLQHHHHQQQQQQSQQHFMTELDKKPVILVVPSVPGPSSSSTPSSSKMAATPMNAGGMGSGRVMPGLGGQAMHGGGGQMLQAQDIPTNLMVKQAHSSSTQPAYNAGGRKLVHASAKKSIKGIYVCSLPIHLHSTNFFNLLKTSFENVQTGVYV